jgi:hypothetical protein
MTTETDQKVDNILNKFDSTVTLDTNKSQNGDGSAADEKEKDGKLINLNTTRIGSD